MYYRSREKKRSRFVSFILFILLLFMTGTLAGLWGVYTGYFKLDVQSVAERFAPTPTATLQAADYIADGDNYMAAGKLTQAIASYEYAIKADPKNDVPYIRQSRLLIYTRETAKSLKRAEQAVILNHNSPENLAYYCRSLDWEAQYSKAFDVCSCAIELDPNYAEGYAFMSEIYADLGNGKAAVENARQAIDINYQSMDAHHNMGYAMLIQGRDADAAEFYDNAIQLAPTLAPLYVDAGRVYYRMSDFEMASARFKKAIKLSPFDPEAYDQLGWTYYLNGEYVRAIDALEQSIGVNPTYVSPYRRESAWGHLGTVYYTRQRFEESTDFLIKAVELGESEFLRSIRRIEIHTKIETPVGMKAAPILRGDFVKLDIMHYAAQFQPITYLSGQNYELEEQSCSTLIKNSIQNEPLPLGSTPAIASKIQAFSRITGTASLNIANGILSLDLNNMPLTNSSSYEAKITFWPDRIDSVSEFQPDKQGRARFNFQFEEKRYAPIEFYYQIGLAYTYTDPPLCDKAVPWLLKSLEIDSSSLNPAWYGLRICPSNNSPPTPIPTITPMPKDRR